MAQDNLKNPSYLYTSEVSYKHNKCLLLSLIILAIGIFLGFMLYKVLIPVSPDVAQKNYNEGYSAAMELARQKVEQKGVFIAAGANGTNVPRAIVKSVSGNKVLVEINSSLIDFFSEGTTTKTISITDATKIEQLTPKPIEEFNAEQDKFRKYIEDSRGSELGPEDEQMSPPSPFYTKVMSASDLKEGDLISFYGNGDLSKSDSIEVSNITLTVQPVAPINDIKLEAPQPQVSDTDITAETNNENAPVADATDDPVKNAKVTPEPIDQEIIDSVKNATLQDDNEQFPSSETEIDKTTPPKI